MNSDSASHQSDSTPRLLRKSDLAKQLSISERHVERLAQAGHLPPPIRLGRVVRYSSAAIEAWILDGCPMRSTGDRL